MNKFLSFLFASCMIFSATYSVADDAREWHKKHMNDNQVKTSDTLLKNNGQVQHFLPSDIQGEDGTSTACNDRGEYVDSNRAVSRCYNYRSNATNTSWRIRYVQHATDPDVPVGDVVVAQIFKVKNGKRLLWASFNGRRENTYASADAQKFAGTKGDSNTDVATGTESVGNSVKEASKMDPKEIVKKGIGAIFKGF